MIVGLGNPGEQYRMTRHNAGFMVVDAVLAEAREKHYRTAEELPGPDDSETFAVSLPKVPKNRGLFLLAKPMTYMNRSGVAVARLCKEHGVSPQNVLVVHDEMDLPLGRLKIKKGGGVAGHNGLRSLVDELGTDAFTRLRVGIGRPEQSWQVKDYVLTPFSPVELELLPPVLARARDALPLFFGRGLSAAQQFLHPFDAAAETAD